MSMTPVPVCWQTTVTAENEKESCSTGFSACGGARKRHSTIPPQCDPRGAFLSYGNEVSYMIKITGGTYKPHPFTRSIRIRRTCGTSAAPRGRKIHPAHSIRGKVG